MVELGRHGCSRAIVDQGASGSSWSIVRGCGGPSSPFDDGGVSVCERRWAVVSIRRSWWWVVVANRPWLWRALAIFRGRCEKTMSVTW